MCPANVASDHKVVAAKVKWILKNDENVKGRCNKDLTYLRNSECAKKSNHVNSQFHIDCTNDPKKDYTLFSQLAREAIDKFVPERSRVTRRKPWENSDIEAARMELILAEHSFHIGRPDDNKPK